MATKKQNFSMRDIISILFPFLRTYEHVPTVITHPTIGTSRPWRKKWTYFREFRDLRKRNESPLSRTRETRGTYAVLDCPFERINNTEIHESYDKQPQQDDTHLFKYRFLRKRLALFLRALHYLKHCKK
jgi:hypothetical protein